MKREFVPSFVYEQGYTRAMAKASVGAGWAKLIDRVFDKLEDMTSGSARLEALPRIIQVKEKWGGLRIYTSNDAFSDFEQFVLAIEKESFTICEECGKPGQLRNGGWYRTLCDTHAEGRPVVEPF